MTVSEEVFPAKIKIEDRTGQLAKFGYYELRFEKRRKEGKPRKAIYDLKSGQGKESITIGITAAQQAAY